MQLAWETKKRLFPIGVGREGGGGDFNFAASFYATFTISINKDKSACSVRPKVAHIGAPLRNTGMLLAR
jgi:hypothetical protein